jgi:uncharacterized protein (UPF0264 family)
MKHISKYDPRTIARDLGGVFDAVFPQLAPGVVASLNRRAREVAGTKSVPQSLVRDSNLQQAMLFEIAVAAGEELFETGRFNLNHAIEIAVLRQRRYFDASLSGKISSAGIEVIERVAANLVAMIEALSKGSAVALSPMIPGFRWIASGVGDLAYERTLIEVKCITGNFSSADYRQVLIYWLLSYAGAMEGRGGEWEVGVLLNPRLCSYVEFKFSSLVNLLGAGRSKAELVQAFSVLIDSEGQH